MKNFSSRILTLAGILLIIFSLFLYWQKTTPRRVAFNLESNFNTRDAHQGEAVPTKLIINELGIELPVFGAEIVGNNWPVTKNGVSFLSSSALPGTKGNSILYGHNWNSLLGPLTKAKPGQKIEVLLSDGNIVNFVVDSTQIVSPNQASVLAESRDKRLTIYTCTGFLDSQRFVVSAL